jgi:hypothetical protein
MSAKIHTPKNSAKLYALKASDLPATASRSTRRTCKSIVNKSTFSQLPFIHTKHHEFNPVSNWHVPPTEGYSQACDTGREYAAHFAQYLRDNPDMCGANLLGAIARDIDFKDSSNAAGYWVGFFSYLERIIFAKTQRMDVFDDVERVKEYYSKMNGRIGDVSNKHAK